MSRPLPVLPGVYYGRILGGWEGLPSNNTYCFKATPSPGTELLDREVALSVSTTAATVWQTYMLPVMHNTYGLTGATTYPLGDPISPAQVFDIGGPGTVAGSVAGSPLAVVIRHTVLRRGKGSQGRTYLSPVPLVEITSDGKSIGGTYADTITTAYNNWWGFVTSSLNVTYPTMVFSFVQLGRGRTVPTPVAPTTYTILESACETALSTQRRRTRR